MGEGLGLLERGREEKGIGSALGGVGWDGQPTGGMGRGRRNGDGDGVDGCSIGVKRLPEIGDDGGDRDGDVVFAKRSLEFFPSSSSLKSACMKYLVCLVIYKNFLYSLRVQKIWVLAPSSNGSFSFFFSLRICRLSKPAANLEPQILGFHFDD